MSTPAGVVVVTDRRQASAPLPEVVAAAAAGGARWVLLREKDLPWAERFALAESLRQILHPVGGRLIVAGPDPLDGDAIHLAAADPLPDPDRPPLIMEFSARHADDTPQVVHDQRERVAAAGWLVGRSCHDVAELDRLTVEHYATVSPVFASVSKPGYEPALGVDGLRALCRRSTRPLLALGGVATPEQAAACVDAGAAGVAVMGAVMRAEDPGRLVAALQQAGNIRQEAG